MVYIKLKGKDGINVKARRFADLKDELEQAKRIAVELEKQGEKILGFSLRRKVKTYTNVERAMLKDLSVSTKLSFFVKPLDRLYDKHEVIFEDTDIENIFTGYITLIKRLLNAREAFYGK